VTTEEDFRAMIDANPLDFGTLLVFADWLDDRDDSRAEAWRALGVQRVAVFDAEGGKTPRWIAPERYTFGDYRCGPDDHSLLPDDWFSQCAGIVGPDRVNLVDPGSWFGLPTAREAYDVAVTAFLQLSAERRAELCEQKAVAA
jgi:uncharacterized protein (TIGR02996 family)